MKHLSILTLAGILALSLATRAEDAAPAPKHQGRPGPGRTMGLVPPMLVEKLDLTADQKTKLADIEKEYAAEREKLPAGNRDEMRDPPVTILRKPAESLDTIFCLGSVMATLLVVGFMVLAL